MTKLDQRTLIRNLNPTLYRAVKVYAKRQRLNIGQWMNKAIAAQLKADVGHKARPCPFCLKTIIDKKTAGIAVIHQDRKTYAVYCCNECAAAIKERGR